MIYCIYAAGLNLLEHAGKKIHVNENKFINGVETNKKTLEGSVENTILLELLLINFKLWANA